MAGQIYQLKVTILGTQPPVWRRLLVADSTTLPDLHRILQNAFGWEDCHLHAFTIEGLRFGTDIEDDTPPDNDESRAHLRQIAKEGTLVRYLYDFGDSWEHDILVEKITDRVAGIAYPVCTDGDRACPPEDCGGVWGFGELLEIILDPLHAERDAMLEWVGEDYNPTAFDKDEVNRQLRRLPLRR
ncbi:plasmid pRiA4b ORF-3 family protein [Ferrimicrobium sp.]|uniref:plasmid pRiA4b ORF-3 family protein n=1 Tax=Ferrimicrobium sp. TaxID=2926050 RepID=UPI002623B6DB|nr:plasmid pRiA4b ORF-3 family protein [Ferrimicrobium sp.]